MAAKRIKKKTVATVYLHYLEIKIQSIENAIGMMPKQIQVSKFFFYQPPPPAAAAEVRKKNAN